MAVSTMSKAMVEVCVKALTDCVGINPFQLIFLWEERSGLARLGTDGRRDDEIATLRVRLGERKWTTLIFTGSEMRDLEHLSERIHLQHRSEILEALRRLNGLSTPVRESECPDRWVTEGDAFPGEPA